MPNACGDALQTISARPDPRCQATLRGQAKRASLRPDRHVRARYESRETRRQARLLVSVAILSDDQTSRGYAS